MLDGDGGGKWTPQELVPEEEDDDELLLLLPDGFTEDEGLDKVDELLLFAELELEAATLGDKNTLSPFEFAAFSDPFPFDVEFTFELE